MRSRYSAFALGLAPYLIETLASTHADRQVPEHELQRGLQAQWQRQRYLGLSIGSSEVRAADGAPLLDARDLREPPPDGSTGSVMFAARIFERGVDKSFAELSQFVVEAGRWRYLAGTIIPKEDLPQLLASAGAAALGTAKSH
jgi:uncharacterized protein YchJ